MKGQRAKGEVIMKFKGHKNCAPTNEKGGLGKPYPKQCSNCKMYFSAEEYATFKKCPMCGKEF